MSISKKEICNKLGISPGWLRRHFFSHDNLMQQCGKEEAALYPNRRVLTALEFPNLFKVLRQRGIVE